MVVSEGVLPRVSAYYARPNALARTLPEPLRSAFLGAWEGAAKDWTVGAVRSGLAGDVANAIIELYAPVDLELATKPPEEGEWFVYSGRAIFSMPTSSRPGKARIKLPRLGWDASAAVRDDCMLTSTSYTNMSGTRTGVLMLGVASSSSTFELVVAGYRDLFGSLAGSQSAQNWPQHLQSSLLRVSRDDLTEVVRRSFEELERMIVYRRGHQVLEGDPTFLDESGFQTFYGMVAPLLLSPFGARVVPEAASGLGPSDFLVTSEAEAQAIEFKRTDSAADLGRLKKGLSVQLPTYMDGHGASRGWYVVLVQGDMPDEALARVRHDLEAANTRPDSISVVLVDGRKQVSASRRSEIPNLLSLENQAP
jgi:hypothetical protein